MGVCLPIFIYNQVNIIYTSHDIPWTHIALKTSLCYSVSFSSQKKENKTSFLTKAANEAVQKHCKYLPCSFPSMIPCLFLIDLVLTTSVSLWELVGYSSLNLLSLSKQTFSPLLTICDVTHESGFFKFLYVSTSRVKPKKMVGKGKLEIRRHLFYF